MALPQSQLMFTEEEYLEFERHAEERHEYLDGHLYAMAGESGEHGDISVNITALLVSQLKGKSCRARAKDTKVRSGPLPVQRRNFKGLFSYPDLVVICGEPQYLDKHRDVVINPQVIIEVLSPSTMDFDRRVKFERYRRWNPTLTDYLLVSQDQPFIEHYELRADGEWIYRTYGGLRRTVRLNAIECALPMREVYDRVSFPPAALAAEEGDELQPPTKEKRR